MSPVVRVLVVSVALMLASAGGPAMAVDVHGDDGGDRFTGTGGVLLPSGGDDGARHRAAGCTDCRWRMTDPCAHSTDPADDGCITVPATCRDPDSQLLRAFMSRDAGQHWEYLGMYCVTDRPTTVVELTDAIEDTFERLVPTGSIAVQPGRGILPHLPVIFDSGQPTTLPESVHEVAGHRVVLTPRATWTWTFGDGGGLVTDIAGSRYPDTRVSHIYRRSGAMPVRLRTVWRATFSVDGIGPLEVVEPVVQEVAIDLTVGQGRAVLTP